MEDQVGAKGVSPQNNFCAEVRDRKGPLIAWRVLIGVFSACEVKALQFGSSPSLASCCPSHFLPSYNPIR